MIYALGPFQVEKRKLLRYLVLIPSRNLFELIYPFLYMPEPAIDISEPGKDLTYDSHHLRDSITLLLVHLVGGENQTVRWDQSGSGRGNELVDFISELPLLDCQAVQALQVPGMKLLEFDYSQFVTQ
jgi:hypothetical protein